MTKKTEIQNLIDTLSHTFEKNAWHGPSVLEALEDLRDVQANQRMGNSHSIVELIAHMTAWRIFVCEKLEGNDAFDIDTDEMNFPTSINLTTALKELKVSQKRLLKLLEQTPIERLDEKVPGRPYKFKVMLNGIIHHDVYHTGQIVLLRKYHNEQL
jgi:uncharacterized damage-inducible protein DinB